MENIIVIEEIIALLKEWADEGKKYGIRRTFVTHDLNEFGDKLFYLFAEKDITLQVKNELPMPIKTIKAKSKQFSTFATHLFETLDEKDKVSEEILINTIINWYGREIKRITQEMKKELSDNGYNMAKEFTKNLYYKNIQ